MKLLIDISDENYSDIINHKWTPRAEIETAISNGVSFDKIRAEIDGIEITGQIDEHTSFIRTGDSVKKIVLEILDKYR